MLKNTLLATLFLCFTFSTVSCQHKVKDDKSISNEKIYVLDAHTHHGFPSLKEEDINHEMNYLKQLGYNAINFSLPINRSNTNNLPDRIEHELKTIKEISKNNSIYKITNLDTLNDYKISCFFHIEYFSGVFNADLTTIDRYKRLGISYITLINNDNDVLFRTENEKTILTELAKKIIKRMNQVDLKIDISHLNQDQRLLVINYSERPIIISHRNCKEIATRDDNISNETLLALKENRGVVMLAFNSNGVFSDKNNTDKAIEKVVDHIDHLKKYIGISKIGIGTDLQAFGRYVPDELNTEVTFNEMVNVLKSRSYTENEIQKILYKNYIEFMQ